MFRVILRSNILMAFKILLKDILLDDYRFPVGTNSIINSLWNLRQHDVSRRFRKIIISD